MDVPDKNNGIWDNQDRCWMGNDAGPFRTSKKVARFGAELLNKRFETTARFKVRPVPDTTYKVKDTVTPPISFRVALKRLGHDAAERAQSPSHLPSSSDAS